MTGVETGVAAGLVEEIPADEVLVVVVVEISEDGKCIMPHVPSAVKTVKFRLCQVETDRYTAAIVLKRGETKTEIPENQGEGASEDQILRKEGHIRVEVTEETHAVMTIQNLQSK